MPLQKFEITADVPEGFEPTGEYRVFGDHEYALDGQGRVTNGRGLKFEAIILRPVWQWPSWLTANWIAMDADGSWWGYTAKPRRLATAWIGDFNKRGRLTDGITNFTPPPCTDWRQSLRQKPL